MHPLVDRDDSGVGSDPRFLSSLGLRDERIQCDARFSNRHRFDALETVALGIVIPLSQRVYLMFGDLCVRALARRIRQQASTCGHMVESSLNKVTSVSMCWATASSFCASGFSTSF